MEEKAKRRGRRGRPEFWRRHLERQAASGASEWSYCRANGLSRSSMRYWRKRVAVEPAGPERLGRRQGSAFVPVEVMSAPTREERRLPDPRWVAEVIRCLAMGDGR
jgi:hypothetical protein